MASAPAASRAPAVVSAAKKVYKSALCIVPPRQCWPAIQRLRCFQDKSFLRWMPHINLLYPFWEDSGDNFQEAAERIHAALAHVQPFKINLAEFDHFGHKNYCTVWLKPHERQALQALHWTLSEAFADCSDLSNDGSRGIAEFQPHLSVANLGVPASQVEQRKQDMLASWETLSFRVEDVFLISRDGFDDPFTLRYRVPLGGEAGGSPQQVDEPYVASVGGEADKDGQEPWPLHSPSGGIWNFAYGANINRGKVEQSRSLSPLESLPARLPGYSLRFNHRGGFGNIESAGSAEQEGDGTPAEVHGVLHRLSCADYCKLAAMEHEYRPVPVQALPYGSSEPVTAMAFMTPPERTIRTGLPPPDRYLKLLQGGALDWPLDASYSAWLGSLSGMPGGNRGNEYYQSPSGESLPAWPKIYTGSEIKRQQRRKPKRSSPGL